MAYFIGIQRPSQPPSRTIVELSPQSSCPPDSQNTVQNSRKNRGEQTHPRSQSDLNQGRGKDEAVVSSHIYGLPVQEEGLEDSLDVVEAPVPECRLLHQRLRRE